MTGAAPPTSIGLRNVTVDFGGARRHDHDSEGLALEDVSLEFPAGTSTALIGPNGAGKTTILNIVAGLVAPTRGAIDRAEGPVGYVLQNPHHERWLPLTVGEVLAMGRFRRLGLLRPMGAEDRAAIAEAAERLEVSDLMHRPFSDLSGGQRQRTLVAQALVEQPTVLLLDEPVSGLDLPSQQRILDLLAEETDRGTTVIVSTHHLDEARHCDQVALIATRVVAVGPPDEALSVPALRTAYGERVLGDHRHHDHDHDLHIIDDHGH